MTNPHRDRLPGDGHRDRDSAGPGHGTADNARPDIAPARDRRWHQPHFLGQPEGVQVFWGYALHPDRVGDLVGKPMAECSGAEILKELCVHLEFGP